MEKKYEVCCEIEGDESNYQPISKHSSRSAAERVARQYEQETGLTAWVDGPDDGEE